MSEPVPTTRRRATKVVPALIRIDDIARPSLPSDYSPSMGRESLRREVCWIRTGVLHARDPEAYVRRLLDAPDAIFETYNSFIGWCAENLGGWR